MATVKRGVLTSAGEWWKHLRWKKREFWKAERQAEKDEAAEQLDELLDKITPENRQGEVDWGGSAPGNFCRSLRACVGRRPQTTIPRMRFRREFGASFWRSMKSAIRRPGKRACE